MMGRYNNIGGFHLLTDEQRQEHGWYKCELYNEQYDDRFQIRTQYPECVYDTERNVVVATYTITNIPLNQVIESRCDDVDKLLQQKMYSDVEVQFPDGPKTIQFRNEIDRANLSNVTQAAISLVLSGQPNFLMPYRTADNVTQYVSAGGMIDIGNKVMEQKQNLVSTAWAHKDALREMEDYPDLLEYDIQEGW